MEPKVLLKDSQLCTESTTSAKALVILHSSPQSKKERHKIHYESIREQLTLA